ncbi:MAG: hypothetical protein JOZ78_24645 [Chroococcidiopsidaceae cyanobacterium CP_BM_ER_R8_30]|nr:hypothetical protein [Chroococcidiopsidaceae cyanobacterium CP_BM_ER_R8_30]
MNIAKKLSLAAAGTALFVVGVARTAPAHAFTITGPGTTVTGSDGSLKQSTGPSGQTNYVTDPAPGTLTAAGTTLNGSQFTTFTPNAPASVPEPSPVWGTLAFSVFGAGWVLKQQKRQIKQG